MAHHNSFFDVEGVLNQLQSAGQISQSLKEDLISAQTEYSRDLKKIAFGAIGEIILPRIDMGKIDSSHLLGIDEIMIFAFYLSRKRVGTKALDLGANIGLHSLILAKLGFDVTAYEPGPNHIVEFKKLINLNDLSESGRIELREVAVTTNGGKVEFIYVHDNSTSSHVLGSLGKNPYGPTSTLKVNSDALREVLEADEYQLIKMDVEGLESSLLMSLSERHFRNTEIILEIGSEDARKLIWDFFSKSRFKISIYSQKNSWRKVGDVAHLPNSYKQGSVIISYKNDTIF